MQAGNSSMKPSAPQHDPSMCNSAPMRARGQGGPHESAAGEATTTTTPTNNNNRFSEDPVKSAPLSEKSMTEGESTADGHSVGFSPYPEDVSGDDSSDKEYPEEDLASQIYALVSQLRDKRLKHPGAASHGEGLPHKPPTTDTQECEEKEVAALAALHAELQLHSMPHRSTVSLGSGTPSPSAMALEGAASGDVATSVRQGARRSLPSFHSSPRSASHGLQGSASNLPENLVSLFSTSLSADSASHPSPTITATTAEMSTTLHDASHTSYPLAGITIAELRDEFVENHKKREGARGHARPSRDKATCDGKDVSEKDVLSQSWGSLAKRRKSTGKPKADSVQTAKDPCAENSTTSVADESKKDDENRTNSSSLCSHTATMGGAAPLPKGPMSRSTDVYSPRRSLTGSSLASPRRNRKNSFEDSLDELVQIDSANLRCTTDAMKTTTPPSDVELARREKIEGEVALALAQAESFGVGLVALIKTWHSIYATRFDEFAMEVFTLMLNEHPEYILLYETADLHEQSKVVVGMIGKAVLVFAHMDGLVEFMVELGAMHRIFTVSEEHFHALSQAFFTVLPRYLTEEDLRMSLPTWHIFWRTTKELLKTGGNSARGQHYENVRIENWIGKTQHIFRHVIIPAQLIQGDAAVVSNEFLLSMLDLAVEQDSTLTALRMRAMENPLTPDRMFQSLTRIIESLKDMDGTNAYIQEIGFRHVAYGLTEETMRQLKKPFLSTCATYIEVHNRRLRQPLPSFLSPSSTFLGIPPTPRSPQSDGTFTSPTEQDILEHGPTTHHNRRTTRTGQHGSMSGGTTSRPGSAHEAPLLHGTGLRDSKGTPIISSLDVELHRQNPVCAGIIAAAVPAQPSDDTSLRQQRKLTATATTTTPEAPFGNATDEKSDASDAAKTSQRASVSSQHAYHRASTVSDQQQLTEVPWTPALCRVLTAFWDHLTEQWTAGLRMSTAKTMESGYAPDGKDGRGFCLLFTDIEASTKLWEDSPLVMANAVQAHHTILRSLIVDYGGYEVKTVGDSFMIATKDALIALKIALGIQLETMRSPIAAGFSMSAAVPDPQGAGDPACWRDDSLRVRVGIHYCTDASAVYDSVHRRFDYYGPGVNLAARVEAAACGGQILMTQEAVDALKETAFYTEPRPRALVTIDHRASDEHSIGNVSHTRSTVSSEETGGSQSHHPQRSSKKDTSLSVTSAHNSTVSVSQRTAPSSPRVHSVNSDGIKNGVARGGDRTFAEHIEKDVASAKEDSYVTIQSAALGSIATTTAGLSSSVASNILGSDSHRQGTRTKQKQRRAKPLSEYVVFSEEEPRELKGIAGVQKLVSVLPVCLKGRSFSQREGSSKSTLADSGASVGEKEEEGAPPVPSTQADCSEAHAPRDHPLMLWPETEDNGAKPLSPTATAATATAAVPQGATAPHVLALDEAVLVQPIPPLALPRDGDTPVAAAAGVWAPLVPEALPYADNDAGVTANAVPTPVVVRTTQRASFSVQANRDDAEARAGSPEAVGAVPMTASGREATVEQDAHPLAWASHSTPVDPRWSGQGKQKRDRERAHPMTTGAAQSVTAFPLRPPFFAHASPPLFPHTPTAAQANPPPPLPFRSNRRPEARLDISEQDEYFRLPAVVTAAASSLHASPRRAPLLGVVPPSPSSLRMSPHPPTSTPPSTHHGMPRWETDRGISDTNEARIRTSQRHNSNSNSGNSSVRESSFSGGYGENASRGDHSGSEGGDSRRRLLLLRNISSKAREDSKTKGKFFTTPAPPQAASSNLLSPKPLPPQPFP